MTPWSGMTLREYYAGLALQGMLANPDRGGQIFAFTIEAVEFADALVARLEKGDE
jgi:hypothetical protein